ncbi:MAG: diguanylate cyclase [Sulfurimonas sp. RIFCSPHIGHO2_12_FULL_36_9]|uniref:sensor domain-containing diguanylate cyclase n=1 Tax=Sulfurimonas sp. RIFCSPLOWO2_12_36_12 TaxID=1802253 RepID=UPI0008D59970|nr:sensor domain-containing diguanylate cyclase [Sulfurimonas sp. RIFCSPLOWO2_12_36_12]OHD97914.1 MAG: diguanylate cyclase [Sulfurimonas sp. RIFCSPLOWO2_02_FULL_36_28]OHD98743.1 MAG: diguanylate cyclase [Sulfurimonas sp. RIFCSPHIGHO2_12_FULL_36_9]OHE02012.1 MAG: diguanylate cyclase [Sulfurimonas sp. RIFCSPLOWO2_12_36_12]OHE08289.1 MAG: diguanylate cyclase [Sulfurimonas sp. RIFCSPLOWO2_12_FULL_36_74]
MMNSHKFLKLVLDTVTQHISVIDKDGEIVYVNKNWVAFGEANNYSMHNIWDKVNYLKECDKSALRGDELGAKAAEGIRDVINKVRDFFYFEYPCHSLYEKRWFMMRVVPFGLDNKEYYVISHENITERVSAEEKVLNQSRIDGLTDIANRRYFDEFLENEWKRCTRLKLPLSLAIIDLDHFKLLNDTYGHQAGDECLRRVGAVLKKFVHRPADLCARYGGEEFAIVLGDTTAENSFNMMNDLVGDIRALGIENKNSSVIPTLTASVGVATMYPHSCDSKEKLITAADKMLYEAKESGRNKVLHSKLMPL